MECNCAKLARVVGLALNARWVCPRHGLCGVASMTEWFTQYCPHCGAAVVPPQWPHSARVALTSNEPCPACVDVGLAA